MSTQVPTMTAKQYETARTMMYPLWAVFIVLAEWVLYCSLGLLAFTEGVVIIMYCVGAANILLYVIMNQCPLRERYRKIQGYM